MGYPEATERPQRRRPTAPDSPKGHKSSFWGVPFLIHGGFWVVFGGYPQFRKFRFVVVFGGYLGGFVVVVDLLTNPTYILFHKYSFLKLLENK